MASLPPTPSQRFEASNPEVGLFHNAPPHPDVVYRDLLPLADDEPVIIAVNGGAFKTDPLALEWLEEGLKFHLAPNVMVIAGGGSGSMQKAREARGPDGVVVARKPPYARQHAPLEAEWNVAQLNTEESRLQLFAEARIHLVFAGGTGTRLEQAAAQVEAIESARGRVVLVDPEHGQASSWSTHVMDLVGPDESVEIVSSKEQLFGVLRSVDAVRTQGRRNTLDAASKGGAQALSAKAAMQATGRPVIAVTGGASDASTGRRHIVGDAIDALCNVSGYAALVDGNDSQLCTRLNGVVPDGQLITRVQSGAELHPDRVHQYVASREWANHLVHVEADAHVMVAGDLRAMRRAYAAVINSAKETGYPVPLVVVDIPGGAQADAFLATLKDEERPMVSVARNAGDVVAAINRRHLHVLGGKLTRARVPGASDTLSLQLRINPTREQRAALAEKVHETWKSRVVFVPSAAGGAVMTMDFTGPEEQPLALLAALEVETTVNSVLGPVEFQPFSPGLTTTGSYVPYGRKVTALPVLSVGPTRPAEDAGICRALL